MHFKSNQAVALLKFQFHLEYLAPARLTRNPVDLPRTIINPTPINRLGLGHSFVVTACIIAVAKVVGSKKQISRCSPGFLLLHPQVALHQFIPVGDPCKPKGC